MKKKIVNFVLFLMTTGWLAPLAISFSLFDSWVKNIVEPRLYKAPEIGHSLPFYDSSVVSFRIGFCWFALVVIFWAGYFLLYKPFSSKP